LCHELAVVRARELEKGNHNRATLAVARKMVCYLLAVDRRNQDFVPAEKFSRTAAALKASPIRKSKNIRIY
jgi:transposase